MVMTWLNALRICIGKCAKVVVMAEELHGSIDVDPMHACMARIGFVKRFDRIGGGRGSCGFMVGWSHLCSEDVRLDFSE